MQAHSITGTVYQNVKLQRSECYLLLDSLELYTKAVRETYARTNADDSYEREQINSVASLLYSAIARINAKTSC